VTDSSEPAIPIVAALPLQAHRDLLDLAEVHLGGLNKPGLRLQVDVTEDRAANLTATVTALNVAGGKLDVGARLKYTGRYSGSVYVQWTRSTD
jgi:hypothetical protein